MPPGEQHQDPADRKIRMPKIQWDTEGERIFETGVDRGMIYLPLIPGIAWNGLVKISESPAGGSVKEYYIDGEKYLDVPVSGEYSATIEALSVPDGFAPCRGLLRLMSGLYVSHQPHQPFGFSYRTLIGDNLQGTDAGYKIHIVYNALAKIADYVHQTDSERLNPKTFSLTVTTIPEVIKKFSPMAHFVIDSRKVPSWLLDYIENTLYGDELNEPRLPSSQELAIDLEGISVADIQISIKRFRISGSGNGISEFSGGISLKKMQTEGPSIDIQGDISLKKMGVSGAVAVANMDFRGGYSHTISSSSRSCQLPLTGWKGDQPKAGDFLVCSIRHSDNSAQTWRQTGGSAWTKLYDNEGESKNGSYSYSIWYRVMQSGESAPTFTWTSSARYIISAAAIKKFGSLSMLLAETSAKINAGTETSGVNSIDPDSVSAAVPGRCSLVGLVGRSSTAYGNGTPTFTPPAGWTVATFLEGDSSATNPRIAGWAYKLALPSGTIDPGSTSWTDNKNNHFAMSVIQMLIRLGP